MSNEQQRALRVGVIGLGFGGEMALRAYKQIPQVEIVALAGLEEERLNHLGQTYAVPNLYHHYEELIARDDLDAVSIGVPNYLHAPIAIAALEKRLHVLCEKPLARNSREGEAMMQAAVKANRVLQVVFNHRERGDVQFLKEYIDGGHLGRIYYAKAWWMRRRGIPGAGSWFVNKEMSGGGPLIDLGVHILDMVLYLTGEPDVLTVSASTYAEFGARGLGVSSTQLKTGAGNTYEVEDLGTAFIRLSNGTTLLLETSWATHSDAGDDYGLMLYGTEGGAKIDVKNYNWQDTVTLFTDIAGVSSDIRPKTVRGDGHLAVTREFVHHILDGNWSLYNGSEGLKRTKVIDACYMSAIDGREITL